jgi:hypothetical protein
VVSPGFLKIHGNIDGHRAALDVAALPTPAKAVPAHLVDTLGLNNGHGIDDAKIFLDLNAWLSNK